MSTWQGTRKHSNFLSHLILSGIVSKNWLNCQKLTISKCWFEPLPVIFTPNDHKFWKVRSILTKRWLEISVYGISTASKRHTEVQGWEISTFNGKMHTFHRPLSVNGPESLLIYRFQTHHRLWWHCYRGRSQKKQCRRVICLWQLAFAHKVNLQRHKSEIIRLSLWSIFDNLPKF